MNSDNTREALSDLLAAHGDDDDLTDAEDREAIRVTLNWLDHLSNELDDAARS